MDIVSALDAERGLVSVVGAGGKKTTLYALAERIDRAVVTATVRIPIFDQHVASVAVTEDPLDALRAADEWPLGLVPERERDDRYRGYDAAVVGEIAAVGDAVLVKADGARRRWFKAPADDEPQVPAAATVVVPVVSVRVVGEPLSEERVHRPERVAALTDLSVGDAIGVNDVVALSTHPSGGLKGVPEGAAVRPLLNMVDDDGLEATARDIADRLLEHRRVERVVLGRMDLRNVVDVVE